MDATTPVKLSDQSFDSDETRLNSPSPGGKVEQFESDSSESYIETYTLDEEYTGPAYASQPCSKHGVSYTLSRWKRILVEGRKLEYSSDQIDNSLKHLQE